MPSSKPERECASPSCDNPADTGAKHCAVCAKRYADEIARAAVRSALRGPAKQRVIRERARGRARAKRRRKRLAT